MSNEGGELPGLPRLPEIINVEEELDRLSVNPVNPLLKELPLETENPFADNPGARLISSYELYYRSLERFLPEASTAARFRAGPHYVHHEQRSYTDYERRLADRFHEIKGFLQLDFFNCILQARILCDRLVGVSRYFLPDDEQPSFTSFHGHRKHYRKKGADQDCLERYVELFCNRTDWFDTLKLVRDKYIVHPGERHDKFWGHPFGTWELTVTIVSKKEKSDNSRPLVAEVSIPRLARELESFLQDYNEIGLEML